jgi:hypothetical protein
MWFWNQKGLIIEIRFLRVSIFLLEGRNENAYHLWFGCLLDNWKWPFYPNHQLWWNCAYKKNCDGIAIDKPNVDWAGPIWIKRMINMIGKTKNIITFRFRTKPHKKCGTFYKLLSSCKYNACLEAIGASFDK